MYSMRKKSQQLRTLTLYTNKSASSFFNTWHPKSNNYSYTPTFFLINCLRSKLDPLTEYTNTFISKSHLKFVPASVSSGVVKTQLAQIVNKANTSLKKSYRGETLHFVQRSSRPRLTFNLHNNCSCGMD